MGTGPLVCIGMDLDDGVDRDKGESRASDLNEAVSRSTEMG